jgi:hypothetical protein
MASFPGRSLARLPGPGYGTHRRGGDAPAADTLTSSCCRSTSSDGGVGAKTPLWGSFATLLLWIFAPRT